MTWELADLRGSPNALARDYAAFRVSERLLLTGHSHQAWPDVGFAAQQQAWQDAAQYVDEKWEHAFARADRVRRGYATLLGDRDGDITLAPNTHELVVRFLSALPLRERPKLVSTDAEFHTVRRQLDRLAEERGVEPEQLQERLDGLRRRMFEAREQRVRPGLDDKVLTSWNGLTLAAFAEAARVLGDAGYRETAERNAAFVRRELWRDGRLLHSYKNGIARVDGLIEDYTYYGLGLLELFRATGELAHLTWAAELFEVVLARFHDRERGGFFDTPEGGEVLLLRQKSFFDAATPSGNGSAALLALWLGRYFARPEWEQLGHGVARLAAEQVVLAPNGFGSLLQAVELMLSPHREVALIGRPDARGPLERELARHFLPATVIAPSATGGGLPVLEGRDAGDGALAYVCEDMACQLPVATAEELAAQLRA